MMKVKFNHFERVAGIFVLIAAGGLLAGMAGVAIKQGWFDSKTTYRTVFESADGIHSGTEVQLAGLRAGAVNEVELRADNQIAVEFWVFSRFDDKIRENSEVTLIRPFIIGDRILDVTVGTPDSPKLAAGGEVPSRESMDFMTLMSGRKLGTYLSSMTEALSSLRFLAEAFLDKGRTEGLVKMFDRIQPLIENVNTMSVEVIKLSRTMTKDERLAKTMVGLAAVTSELNEMLPAIRERAPQMAKDMEKMIANLAILTEESKALLPALAEIAPDLPKTSRRAVEALDEAVVLLKAMQRSFVLSGSAKEVRKEEAEREKSKSDRKPAGE